MSTTPKKITARIELHYDVGTARPTFGATARVWWNGGQAEVASQGSTHGSALRNIAEAIALRIEAETVQGGPRLDPGHRAPFELKPMRKAVRGRPR